MPSTICVLAGLLTIGSARRSISAENTKSAILARQGNSPKALQHLLFLLNPAVGSRKPALQSHSPTNIARRLALLGSFSVMARPIAAHAVKGVSGQESERGASKYEYVDAYEALLQGAPEDEAMTDPETEGALGEIEFNTLVGKLQSCFRAVSCDVEQADFFDFTGRNAVVTIKGRKYTVLNVPPDSPYGVSTPKLLFARLRDARIPYNLPKLPKPVPPSLPSLPSLSLPSLPSLPDLR